MDKETWDYIHIQHQAMHGYENGNFFAESDRDHGLPQPPLGFRRGGAVTELPKDFSEIGKDVSLVSALESRKSRRKYTDEPISLTELSFLLYYTQGIKKMVGVGHHASFRTVPSAGSCHPLELYFVANYVTGLVPGVYHYIPFNHTVERVYTEKEILDGKRELFSESVLGLSRENPEGRASEAFRAALTEMLIGMKFAGNAPLVFAWTANPYRVEWRYRAHGPKYCLIDAGHSCQNLYLASEAIHAGCCGMGAFWQNALDSLLNLNGAKLSTDEEAFRDSAAPTDDEKATKKNERTEAYEDASTEEDRNAELTIYCAAVGHIL